MRKRKASRKDTETGCNEQGGWMRGIYAIVETREAKEKQKGQERQDQFRV